MYVLPGIQCGGSCGILRCFFGCFVCLFLTLDFLVPWDPVDCEFYFACYEVVDLVEDVLDYCLARLFLGFHQSLYGGLTV